MSFSVEKKENLLNDNRKSEQGQHNTSNLNFGNQVGSLSMSCRCLVCLAYVLSMSCHILLKSAIRMCPSLLFHFVLNPN
jgi:hypothetical protein